MKAMLKTFATVTTMGLILLAMSRAHAAPAGQVDFGQLAPGGGDTEFVEIRVSKNLINLAMRLIEKQEPEVAKVLAGVDGVRVNVVGIDDTNRGQLTTRAEEIRSKLETSGWERVVTVTKKDEDVGIYLKSGEKDTVEGITAVIMQDGKEAVFINVVGNIKPDQIALLGERLQIETLNKAGKAVSPQEKN